MTASEICILMRYVFARMKRCEIRNPWPGTVEVRLTGPWWWSVWPSRVRRRAERVLELVRPLGVEVYVTINGKVLRWRT